MGPRTNLFIPSTLCGPNIKEGQFDIETHERNMEAATEPTLKNLDLPEKYMMLPPDTIRRSGL